MWMGKLVAFYKARWLMNEKCSIEFQNQFDNYPFWIYFWFSFSCSDMTNSLQTMSSIYCLVDYVWSANHTNLYSGLYILSVYLSQPKHLPLFVCVCVVYNEWIWPMGLNRHNTHTSLFSHISKKDRCVCMCCSLNLRCCHRHYYCIWIAKSFFSFFCTNPYQVEKWKCTMDAKIYRFQM